MAKLLGRETVNGITENYWLHTGDDGDDRITVETIHDVEPLFDAVMQKSQARNGVSVSAMLTGK